MSTSPGSFPPTLAITPAAKPIDSDVTLPGSKSITNRALIIAALADGETTLAQALFSEDTAYMCASLNRLGIEVDADEASSRFVVHGRGGTIPASEASLFIGNSGTSARFLTAMVALGHGTYEIDGVARMRQRPIEPLLAALRELGVDSRSLTGNGCPPVSVRSEGLTGGRVTMSGDTSSQYFTGLLMVGPLTARSLEIEVDGDLVSKPYLDMTIATMNDFGAAVENDGYRRFFVRGNQRYQAGAYAIEPDASAASYFFALAAVSGGRVRVLNLGKESVQGDVAFVDVLEKMGCSVTRTNEWIEVTGPEQLHGVDIDMNAISDTVPTLAAIAPLAGEPVTIRDVEHIRHKETDRITAVATELRRLGISVDERQEGLTIVPGMLRPATIQTYDDHRIAMSFAILGTQSEGITIGDPGCVAKTFPGFFDKLAEATRS
jgi:3-phosphoshikimate 1-carboxyvinyltransferase